MTRVHGFAKGGLTFLGDCLKGVLVALIGRWLGGQIGACVGGTFAALGHMWPVFFRFKGGKGVATCIGVGLVTYPPFGALAFAAGVAVIIGLYYCVFRAWGDCGVLPHYLWRMLLTYICVFPLYGVNAIGRRRRHD